MITALIVAAGLVASVAVAIRLGKAIHRANHRQGLIWDRDLPECPPWCVRERAAALLPYGCGRHRRRAR